jgi:hypothetical protein
VFHLAANTHTWERNHDCNDLGTENLLRALQPLGPKTHVVFTSTTAVMDNRDDLDQPLESARVVARLPFSAYGRSKWRAEQFLRVQAAKYGFRLSILRLCTVYGPEPRPNTLFAVLKQEVARQSLASRLDWPGLTSFIHVDDVVSCLLRVGGVDSAQGRGGAGIVYKEGKRNGTRVTARRKGGTPNLNSPSPECSPRGKGGAQHGLRVTFNGDDKTLAQARAEEAAGQALRLRGCLSPRFTEKKILPEPGETGTYLLATESRTLAYVSRLLHAKQGLPYRMILLPDAAWKVLRRAHEVCRCGAGRLPVWVFNFLWRLDVVVNPLFHCDVTAFCKWFPGLNPRLIADTIDEI